jgi:hypothetical protein
MTLKEYLDNNKDIDMTKLRIERIKVYATGEIDTSLEYDASESLGYLVDALSNKEVIRRSTEDPNTVYIKTDDEIRMYPHIKLQEFLRLIRFEEFTILAIDCRFERRYKNFSIKDIYDPEFDRLDLGVVSVYQIEDSKDIIIYVVCGKKHDEEA